MTATETRRHSFRWARDPVVAGRRPERVRLAVIVALLAFVLLALPSMLSLYWVSVATAVAIYAVVALGLGVLMGRVGLVSLGQIALLALGGWVAARLSFATSLPFPVVLLATGLITGVLGTLVGLPALRLSGLYLALITLMLAGAITVVLTATNFPNGGHGFLGHTDSSFGNASVRRPSLAAGDPAYYRYTVIVSLLMFLLALWHVRSKPGRAWAAIRQSEPAALAAGINITLYKLWAFALASFMTGVAGGLLAGRRRQALHVPVPHPRVDHPARGRADGRDLQPLGRARRRHVLQAAARAARQLGPARRPADDPLRRRRPAGAAHRSGRPRRPVPEGHGEARAPDRPARQPGVGPAGRGRGRMIEVEDLKVRFGGVMPIDGMTLTFPGGTCGLIGPNGAGKTTFFNVLSGFVKPAAGRCAPSARTCWR